jgi:hypothetical protein
MVRRRRLGIRVREDMLPPHGVRSMAIEEKLQESIFPYLPIQAVCGVNTVVDDHSV